jgi:hypothetical protein
VLRSSLKEKRTVEGKVCPFICFFNPNVFCVENKLGKSQNGILVNMG